MNKKWMIFLLGAAAVLAAAGLLFWRQSSRLELDFSYSGEAFGNPLMGYAPSAWHDEVAEDVTLLYMDITWRELEPEEGVFDWAAIEEENQLERWRAEGKHIVLRFLCDLPGEEDHRDIPDWLWEKTGGAGEAYANSYGRGFSPDYSHPEFIACHQRAVKALGERYGGDDFISFIELGSLGHWGEWHIHTSDGLPPMPDQQVRAQYVEHWVAAFSNARILMRRPFAEAQEHGLGLYNDMSGYPEATAQWLEWIYQGGEYDQTGEADALVPMPDAWKTAPVGGELTSSLPMEQMLDEQLETTIALLRDSHTTFLGPKIADEEYREGYDAVLLNLGYRLWISQADLSPGLLKGVKITLTWQNSGVAPLYADWPVYLQAVDGDGRVLEQAEVTLPLSQLLPGQTIQTSTVLPDTKLRGSHRCAALQLVIVDPMTGLPAVRLANGEAAGEERVMVLWKAL